MTPKENRIYSSIIEQSPIAIEFYDKEGKLDCINRACMEMFGIESEDEVKGFDLFQDPNIPENMKEDLCSGKSVRFENELDFDVVIKKRLYKTYRSGKSYLDRLITPLFAEDGSIEGYIEQVQDKTTKKQSLLALEEMNAHLENLIAERTQQLEEMNSRLEESNAELEETNAILEKEIVERRKAEEVLEKSALTIHDLYNHAPCGYHSLDPDGVFININDTELEWLGYTREEIIGKKRFSELITHESRVTFQNTFPGFKQRGRVKDLEFDMICKNGNTLPVLLNATAVTDDHGNFLMSRSTIFDMTERKRVEEELHQLNNHLEQRVQERTAQLEAANIRLLNAQRIAHLGSWEMDIATGNCIWSDEFFRICGFEPGAFQPTAEIGFTVIHPEDRERAGIAVQKAIDGNSKYEIEKRIVRPDGTIRHVLSQGEILFDKENNPQTLAGSFLDITERKLAETELISAKEAAEAATQAKSQFLANMSHEIRTPMNGIIGMTDLALMTELTGEQAEYLSIVQSSSRSLLRVLNDILDYSKIEAGKMNLEKSPFSLPDTISEIMELFSLPAKQKGLSLRMILDANVPHTLEGDYVRLRQVLSNLIGNAIKFTSYGSVEIEVAVEESTDTRVKLRFVIADTGIGISKENMERLFRSFSQVDNSNTRQFGGTGLGLVISKKIVEMMDGHIWVESREGEGSKFYFTSVFSMQPGETGRNTGEDALNPDTERKNSQNKRILLVEDDQVSRYVAEQLVKRRGCKSVCAGNGAEAMELIEKQTFDLILMDINLPMMDGYTVTAHIRKKEKGHTPIIAMTAYALKGDREKSLQAGMDDYISKPLDHQEFYRVLDRWLNR